MSQKQPFSNGHYSPAHDNRDANDPSTAQKLEALLNIAGDLSVNQGVKKVIGLFKETVDLRDDVDRKDKELAALKHASEVTEKKHKEFCQEQINAFGVTRDKLRDELRQNEAKIEELTSEVAQKVSIVDELKGSEARLKHEVERLQEFATSQKSKVKTNTAKISELEALQDKAQNECTSLREHLREEENKQTRLEAKHRKLQLDFDTLEKERTSTEQQWQLAQSLKIELSPDDPDAISTALDKVWESTVELMNSTFSRDLAADISQTAWAKLRWPDPVQHKLPVPRSNSAVSKQMRIALLLSIVARILDTNIFQPTYLLEPDSGLRDLLLDQAVDESRKESAIRSSILALLPKVQATAATKRAQQACDEIMQVVDGILPGDLQPRFQMRLGEIVQDARSQWELIARSKSAVDPSFELKNYSDWAWQELRLDAGKSTVALRNRESDEDAGGDLLVVFPRCYTWDQDGGDPISHGVVLSDSQVAAAMQEDAEHQSRTRGKPVERTRSHRVSNGVAGRPRDTGGRGFLG